MFWLSLDLNLVTLDQLKSISGLTVFGAYSLLLTTRLITLISSVYNATAFHEIIQQFNEIDLMLLQLRHEIDHQVIYFRLLIKIFAVASVTLVLLLGCLLEIHKLVDLIMFSVLTVTSIHVLHVKELSFVIIVDLLNYRLASLHNLSISSNRKEILNLHLKLFLLSKMINATYGKGITLIILQQCFGLTVNTFWLFLALSKIEFTEIYGG